MDKLEEGGLILSDSRINLLGNTLVLIGDGKLADDFTDIEFIGNPEVSISIGEPESVPAGKYAQEVLGNLGLWDKVSEKLVLAKDVRQVIEYVDGGNVDTGFVYKSDALLMKSGKILAEAPKDSHSPIIYPAALMSESDEMDGAAEFFDFIKSDLGMEIFKKYGFEMIN
jgi:molybdate transport system substrate-binding protein